MAIARKSHDNEEFNIWPTYSDVTFAIVLILLFIMLGQYVVIGKMLEIQEIVKEQELLTVELKTVFPKEYGDAIKDFTQPQFQKIIFSNKILFESGDATLKDQGIDVLAKIAEILNRLKKRKMFDEIQVRGHTDNRKIGWPLSDKFKTNWELSSARAISVVRFFQDHCQLEPSKNLLISAQGYGEYDPITKNETEEDLSMNRRIEIIIKYPLDL